MTRKHIKYTLEEMTNNYKASQLKYIPYLTLYHKFETAIAVLQFEGVKAKEL